MHCVIRLCSPVRVVYVLTSGTYNNIPPLISGVLAHPPPREKGRVRPCVRTLLHHTIMLVIVSSYTFMYHRIHSSSVMHHCIHQFFHTITSLLQSSSSVTLVLSSSRHSLVLTSKNCSSRNCVSMRLNMEIAARASVSSTVMSCGPPCPIPNVCGLGGAACRGCPGANGPPSSWSGSSGA